jgi:hypothetical protein
MNDGAIYTREQFVNDFNGTRQNELEGGYSDFIEITNTYLLN